MWCRRRLIPIRAAGIATVRALGNTLRCGAVAAAGRRQARVRAKPVYPVRPGVATAHLTQPKATPMSDTLPDRLSMDPRSPFHDGALLERGVGIRFKGEERTNVHEYCVSEGWIKVIAGRALDRRGNPMTLKLQGPVEPFLQDDAAADSGCDPVDA